MKRKTILAVDDDAVVLRALTIKLEAKGYHVVPAMDGSQAVSAVRTQKPDLILLDLSFPPEMGGIQWDGFRIMEWIQRVDAAAKIPIIVVSGGDPEKYEARARELGAAAFFHKPIDHAELVELIRQTLGETPVAT
jgi:two-component system KDP operon response regulator KdpE